MKKVIGHRPGGGQGSKANGQATRYFTGQPSTRINEKGVSQIGQNLGNHSTGDGKVLTKSVEPVRGPAMPSVKMGSQVAAETVCGPGGSRVVYGSGVQGTHGPVNPGSTPPRKEIFPGFPGNPAKR